MQTYPEWAEGHRQRGLEQGREEGHAEGHAEGREEGHAEGHAKGHAEGHAKGHAEGRRTALVLLVLRQAARRFGREVARQLEGILRSMGAEQLTRVGDAVVECDTADEFLAAAGSSDAETQWTRATPSRRSSRGQGFAPCHAARVRASASVLVRAGFRLAARDERRPAEHRSPCGRVRSPVQSSWGWVRSPCGRVRSRPGLCGPLEREPVPLRAGSVLLRAGPRGTPIAAFLPIGPLVITLCMPLGRIRSNSESQIQFG